MAESLKISSSRRNRSASTLAAVVSPSFWTQTAADRVLPGEVCPSSGSEGSFRHPGAQSGNKVGAEEAAPGQVSSDIQHRKVPQERPDVP